MTGNTSKRGLSSLRHRDFSLLIVGKTFGWMALHMTMVAIAYQVYDRTGDVMNLAYIGLATFAPAIGFALITGYVADLFDRRLVLVVTYGVIFLGAVLLYLGGTTLNDAVDVKFDRENRPERPIPSGVFSVKTVWAIGIAYLAVGSGLLLTLTRAWSVWIGALVVAIVVYDIVHKKWKGAVFVMGSCRLFLYLVAASAAKKTKRSSKRTKTHWLQLRRRKKAKRKRSKPTKTHWLQLRWRR